jgi:hypothetical protein
MHASGSVNVAAQPGPKIKRGTHARECIGARLSTALTAMDSRRTESGRKAAEPRWKACSMRLAPLLPELVRRAAGVSVSTKPI